MNHTFLLGAGFNLDANFLVSPYPATHWTDGEYGIHEPYLDMRRFASHIFPGEHILNFEERIDEAIRQGETDRIQAFVDKLMGADHYIDGRLEGNHGLSKVSRIFRHRDLFNMTDLVSKQSQNIPAANSLQVQNQQTKSYIYMGHICFIVST